MSKNILHVVENAYRATLEEQDDTVLWLVQALKGAGAQPAVLLRGSAVNYLVAGQDASGLAFGERKQTRPPALPADLTRMMSKGIAVFAVAEDLEERGVATAPLISGAKQVHRRDLPSLFASYQEVWQW